MSFLIITGSFACGMAFHNTTARYFYSLGREGLLPRQLGRTHPKWKSPHIASVTQSVIAALIILGFAVFVGTGDPLHIAYLQVYGLMAVMGVIIILAVQALVSLSILIYYTKEHPEEVHWWKTRIAPAISFIAQAIVIYLLFKNILFLGSGYHYAVWLGPDRPAGGADRRRRGVLLQAQEPGEVRVRRTARQRRALRQAPGWDT